jgi:NitT/TauT family transport system ATP-binding protein
MTVSHAESMSEGTGLTTSSSRGRLLLAEVSKTYVSRTGNYEALQETSLVIEPGEVVSVVGPSGCGKSTLLKIIAGLIPFSGEILIDEEPISGPHHDIGFMFQSAVLFPWRTVLDNVLLPARLRRDKDPATAERARKLLDLVGLDKMALALPNELSGGMQQRAALCRVLLNDPHILLLDEPFASLDEFTRERLNLELMSIQESTGKTVVFVTHNVIEAVFLSDRVAVMSKGPGRVKGIVPIYLPRPRTTSVMRTPVFTDYVFEVRELLGLDLDERSDQS